MAKTNKITLSILLISALVFQTVFTMFAAPVLAKADDLVIEDNGAVLLIMNDNSVLAVETKQNENKKPATPQPAPVTKVIVSPNTTSTVKLNTTKDNKIDISVQTPIPNPTAKGTLGQPGSPIPATGSQTKGSPAPSTGSPAETNTVKTTVNKVVLNVPDNPISITPTPDTTNNLNVQQGSINVSTTLPLQIGNTTQNGTVAHDIVVTTSSGPTKLSVLPDVAVKGAEDQISGSSLKVDKKEVSLTQNTPLAPTASEPTYVVKEQRKGKLLGIINVTVSSEVNLSAKTGKTLSVWQSPIAALGFLIK